MKFLLGISYKVELSYNCYRDSGYSPPMKETSFCSTVLQSPMNLFFVLFLFFFSFCVSSVLQWSTYTYPTLLYISLKPNEWIALQHVEDGITWTEATGAAWKQASLVWDLHLFHLQWSVRGSRVESEHALVVASNQQSRRKVFCQTVEPCHVQEIRHRLLTSYGHAHYDEIGSTGVFLEKLIQSHL